jgi:hypothetical protein
MKISLCITSYYLDIVYINRLIPYIVSQTHKPDEVILFCSGVDKIPDIDFFDLPFKEYFQNKIANPAQARNFCATKASGDLLIFFDIDDYPHPQKIEMTIKYLESYDFLVHSYRINDVKFSPIEEGLVVYNDLFQDASCTNIYCHNRPIHHSHIAVRKKVFNNIKYNDDKTYYKKEDGKFCQDLLQNNYRGIYLDYPLVSYTI